MYSPKTSEQYIPALYRKAKAKKIPMTKLIDNIVAEYFNNEQISEMADERINNEQICNAYAVMETSVIEN